jgi:prolyl-tRNA synthetase
MKILEIYRRLVEDQIAIPVLIGKKTEREKFKGAVYTTTLEAMMPDGKAIQMGTSHHLGQNFSKPFEIKYLGKDEKEHFAWTTSWGISWRLIGAMIMAHGDDKGLVLPPRVAPTQVVFVPIHYKESDKKVILETAHHIAEGLGKHSIRTYIDDRDQYTPGWKYHEWEMKGVPLRVEIGPRDMESKQITLVRRDTGKKTAVSQADSITRIVKELDEIQQSLLHSAQETQAKLTTTANNMKEFAHIIETTGGFVKAFLSEDNDCEERIKLETGATVRIVPFKESAVGQCVYCGAPNSREVVFARSY